MAGFLQKARVVILGNMHDLLDKTIDLNSIPVLKQYVRDLEDATAQARHQGAVASAQVVTLTRAREQAKDTKAADERRASAYLASGNEAAARTVAGRIHDGETMVASLDVQISAAKLQSEQLNDVVEKLQSKHDSILSRVRTLESQDAGAKAMERGTAAIRNAGAALGSGVDASIDNVANKIQERNDLAQEEFNQSVSDLREPEDPLKTQAVDDILAKLKEKAVPTPVGA